MTMIIPLLTKLVAFTLINCVSALKIEGWNMAKRIPLSYSHISTQNILRCEKLCERQEKCAATTFDNRERICYMHGSNVASPERGDDTRGRYLYKEYEAKVTDNNSGLTCDRNTQITVPSLKGGDEACHDMKDVVFPTTTAEPTPGSIGQSCATPSECVVLNSECRNEGVCGCVAGYSFQPGTQTCEADCVNYGDTFQKFPKKYMSGPNKEEISNKSPDECAALCAAASAYTCVAFEFRPSDNRCALQDVDALDEPSSFQSGQQTSYYQRNCD